MSDKIFASLLGFLTGVNSATFAVSLYIVNPSWLSLSAATLGLIACWVVAID